MVCEKYIYTHSRRHCANASATVFVPEHRLRDGLLRRLRASSYLSDGRVDTAVPIVAPDKRRLKHYPSRLEIEELISVITDEYVYLLAENPP